MNSLFGRVHTDNIQLVLSKKYGRKSAWVLHSQLVVSEWFSEAVDGVSAVVLLIPSPVNDPPLVERCSNPRLTRYFKPSIHGHFAWQTGCVRTEAFGLAQPTVFQFFHNASGQYKTSSS